MCSIIELVQTTKASSARTIPVSGQVRSDYVQKLDMIAMNISGTKETYLAQNIPPGTQYRQAPRHMN